MALSADYIRVTTNHIQFYGINGLWIPIFMACLARVIHYITKYGLAVTSRHLGFKLRTQLRVSLLDRWLHIPYASYEKKQVGQYISIAQNDVENAQYYMYVVFSRIGMSFFNVLMAIPFMIRIDLGLTIMVLTVSIVFGIINQRILKKIKHNESHARLTQEKITNISLSGYNSADSVKIYAAADYMQNLYLKVRLLYSKALMNIVQIEGARESFYTIVNNATLYGSIIFLGYRTIIGINTLGDTISFNILLTQALVAIGMIFRWTGQMVRCNASWERLEQQFITPLPQKKVSSQGVDIKKVNINNFSFDYDDGVQIFSNMAMEFEKGKIYCISGASGSGKTTLIKCLLGLYRTEKGQYYVNDKEVDQDQVADLISYVPSEHYLFQGTVCDNVSLGNNDVSKESCFKIADMLGVGNWLRNLPGGLDYVIETDGLNLSGGQRQSLCILRALLWRRPILVFDEPFSALDHEKEKMLKDALLEIKRNHIILITSHREQTLDICDGFFRLN